MMRRSNTGVKSVWRRGAVVAATPALAAMLAVSNVAGPVAVAQDATPSANAFTPRPAHIHEGSCGEDELGGIIVPLTDLTGATGAQAGNDDATTAQSSYTSVPLPLDAILAADHAINVHRSVEEIEEYIACGELGGAVNANGSLVVGLKELNDSGFTGIAFMTTAEDGVSTDVSVFVAEDLSAQDDDGQRDDDAAGAVVDTAVATPTADADENGDDADATAAADADDNGNGDDADATATAEADENGNGDDADATATAEADENGNGDDADATATAEADENGNGNGDDADATATAEADENGNGNGDDADATATAEAEADENGDDDDDEDADATATAEAEATATAEAEEDDA